MRLLIVLMAFAIAIASNGPNMPLYRIVTQGSQHSILLVDRSGSVKGYERDAIRVTEQLSRAALHRNGNKIEIISFASSANSLTGGFISSLDKAATAFAPFKANGNTNLRSGLELAEQKSRGIKSVNLMVLTDGQPDEIPEETLKRMRSAGYKILFIGYGSISKFTLSQMAKLATGDPNFYFKYDNLKAIEQDLNPSCPIEITSAEINELPGRKEPLKITMKMKSTGLPIPQTIVKVTQPAADIPYFMPQSFSIENIGNPGKEVEITLNINPSSRKGYELLDSIPDSLEFFLSESCVYKVLIPNEVAWSLFDEIEPGCRPKGQPITIAFMGPVGSGKSTRINLINEGLGMTKVAFVGASADHATVAVNMSPLLLKKQNETINLKIQLVDVWGIETDDKGQERWSDDKYTMFLDGRIKMGVHMDDKIEYIESQFRKPLDAIVWVIPASEGNMEILTRIKRFIEMAQKKEVGSVVALSGWENKENPEILVDGWKKFFKLQDVVLSHYSDQSSPSVELKARKSALSLILRAFEIAKQSRRTTKNHACQNEKIEPECGEECDSGVGCNNLCICDPEYGWEAFDPPRHGCARMIPPPVEL
mmetsp:Transcript_6296/g.6846  ORF Transcript_6296/g.6846 Transcript_6296/m.6846 type:complete len:595 (-) Transcript_6296:63-1847(-)